MVSYNLIKMKIYKDLSTNCSLLTSGKLKCHLLFLLFVPYQLVFVLVKCDNTHTSQTVQLPNGHVLIGLEQESFFNARKFVEYRGIPYAKPPIAELRFKAPLEYDEKWSEPRNSIEYGASCPQDDVMNESVEEGNMEEIVKPIGNEDCLFINVATPVKKATNSYPVVIWIHGGSFLYEYGEAYGPKKFMDYDVVFVTFNYRLGALGFLNTGDGLIQGNMGLKDQVLALKWVQKNIGAFGGDPKHVTVSGINSGTVSAHLHMLTPMSEGLFHRVLLQSGSAISPWVLQHNPTKVTKSYLQWFDCVSPENNETLSVYDCLMQADVESLIRKQPQLTEWYIDPLVPMGPSIEVEGEDPKFLSEDPFEILQSGNFWAKDKVSVIAGVNSHEGLLHSWDIAHHRMLHRVLSMEWQRALPITLNYRDTALNFRNISDSVHNYYFAEKDSKNDKNDAEHVERTTPTTHPTKGKGVKDKKTRQMIGREFYKFDELTQMYSDRYFFIPVHKTGELHGRYNASVYLYWFDYQGAQSSTQFSGYNDTVYGAAHFDQIQYMFNSPYFKDPENKEDISFGKKFMGGILRFVATGEPPAGGWVRINDAMLEGSVPFIYNRFGGGKKMFYQLIEPFMKSVQFWDKLPLLEYGKKRDQFPEFLENNNMQDNKDKDGSEEVFPGVTKNDVEKLKNKLEL